MAAVFVGIVYVLAAIFGSLATCATFVGILRHGPLRAFKKHRRDGMVIAYNPHTQGNVDILVILLAVP